MLGLGWLDIVCYCIGLVEFVKCFPLVYHIRVIALLLYHGVSTVCRGGGFRRPTDAEATHHLVTLCDLDWNLHQNNSTYALEADIVRYSWFVRFLGGPRGDLLGFWRRGWTLANGGVAHYFYKELRLHQSYTIQTRLAGFDNKWLYLSTEFCSGGTLHAAGLSRIVVKRGKLTLTPKEVMESLGYSSEDVDALRGTGNGGGGGGGLFTQIAEELRGARGAPQSGAKEATEESKRA